MRSEIYWFIKRFKVIGKRIGRARPYVKQTKTLTNMREYWR